jgi:hypothetical protein
MTGTGSGWNVRRAGGLGLISGLAAFFLWPIFASFPERIFYPFVAALGLTCFCGASILVFTIVDLRNNRRGRRVRPIRAFDVILGFALAGPSALELSALLG